MLRVLLYCDADLNLIDGSSVWTTSIAQVLARADGVRVTLLLKRPISRPYLTEPLRSVPNITLLDPFSDRAVGGPPGGWRARGRLQPEEAAQVMAVLDEAEPFDLVLVRGLRLCRAIVEHPSLAGRVWAYLTDFEEKDAADVAAVYRGAARLLCQTPEIRARLRRLAGATDDRFVLLPPMIPDLPAEPPPLARAGQRLVYVGKLAPLWMTEEMAALMPQVRATHPAAELHVAGDKFHNFPPSPEFPERMQRLLETTPGIVWHRAMSREQAQELVRSCDVGCSWRHPALDDSPELSTKVLEYGAQGKPVLLNRVPMHEDLLGRDYPLFCNTQEEYLAAVDRSLGDDVAYAEASRRAWEASHRFTFSAALERLAPHLPAPRSAAPPAASSRPAGGRAPSRPLCILFAGHDLKFAAQIVADLDAVPDFEVRTDEWAGHSRHDPHQSSRLAEWADVVVAEWCLGNAVWYSRNLPPRTALIVRLHRAELVTSYPDELDPGNVHRLVAVSPWFRDRVRERLPSLGDRVVYLPNAVDCDLLDRPKLGGSGFRLGVLGWVPRLKRLDLALDIFEGLRRREGRYVLFVKGKRAPEYRWVWRDEEERRYFRDQMARVNHAPWRDSVVFEPFSRDLEVWWRKIGFVLSTSDIESFHLSVAEGMASGAIPIIRHRPEVTDLWPEEYVYDEPQEAVEMIERFRAEPEPTDRAQALKVYVRERYDRARVTALWRDLILAARDSL